MFNEYNTKMTYIVEGKLDIKRTVKAYAKFYSALYARIAVNNIKGVYNAQVSSRFSQTLH